MNYAIGDIQGCFRTFQNLLADIAFDPTQDTLWLAGDLVNRGKFSLETLHFIKKLDETYQNIHIVLGNHDLHLLAVAYNARLPSKDDTLDDILQAPDREELIHWLRQKPLLYYSTEAGLGFTMVHAGLCAKWDLATAMRLADEVSTVIRGSDAKAFFENMYGNQPSQWDESLTGWERLRCITHYFTRVRWCYPDGSLEFTQKTFRQKASLEKNDLIPWFNVTPRANNELNILFGHWAALDGVTNTPHVYALDTGCVWGRKLTAMRLEDQKRWSVDAI